MKIKQLAAVGLVALIPMLGNAQVGGLHDTPKNVREMQQIPLHRKILQVLPEGLLFSGTTSTFILVGHPDAKKLADGEMVNCYAVKTDETLKYIDITGAERTARVYRYVTARIGK